MLTNDVMDSPLALWSAYKQQHCPQTFEVKPGSLWRLNIQEIEWRCRYAMISSLNGGSPYESKYSVYPESEKQTATQCEQGM